MKGGKRRVFVKDFTCESVSPVGLRESKEEEEGNEEDKGHFLRVLWGNEEKEKLIWEIKI